MTSYELRMTNDELRMTNDELQITTNEILYHILFGIIIYWL